jgi:hypothetical protein
VPKSENRSRDITSLIFALRRLDGFAKKTNRGFDAVQRIPLLLDAMLQIVVDCRRQRLHLADRFGQATPFNPKSRDRTSSPRCGQMSGRAYRTSIGWPSPAFLPNLRLRQDQFDWGGAVSGLVADVLIRDIQEQGNVPDIAFVNLQRTIIFS